MRRYFLLIALFIGICHTSFADTPNLLQIVGNNRVHVIGDSHSIYSFSGFEACVNHHLGPITMHRVGRDGLSFLNLQKLGVQENDTAIFVFGEIDVRCHIGKQHDLQQRGLDEIINTLVTKYIATIKDNCALYKKINCVVFAIVPPTVPNRTSAEFPTYGSLRGRIAITKKLNRTLSEMALQNGIYVLDVTDDYALADGSFDVAKRDDIVHIHPNSNQPVKAKLAKLLTKIYAK